MRIPKLNKVTARHIQDDVDWLLDKQCGCCHHFVCNTKKYEIDVAVGWHDRGEGHAEWKDGKQVWVEDPDNWTISWKIGMQSFGNAMQTDLDLDFICPWNEDGDVWEISGEIWVNGQAEPTLHDCVGVAKDINAQLRSVVEFQLEMEKWGEGSGKEQ